MRLAVTLLAFLCTQTCIVFGVMTNAEIEAHMAMPILSFGCSQDLQ
jgi:hypothetical protein